ncbi:hypothetical protein F5884DRAFT_852728 [Xylogone sp. PMI_703]|nr:hypothetical protein F5884DRAFT_852728 [Xylogone sp. PMI_703]
MAKTARAQQTPRGLTTSKGNSQSQDDFIMGTNSSSIVSKRSVERLYYPHEPHFFRYFVKKPLRRAPLINRGYWLRMKAIDHVVHNFLKQATTKQKIVINLGCGYDPLPWQCLVRYPELSEGVVFVDIDYPELMLKKREVVHRTPELNSIFSNLIEKDEGEILLTSDQYIQIGCDLRNSQNVSQALSQLFDLKNCEILFTAEVSITYMAIDDADSLISWASTLPEAHFCLLEQLLPAGITHPFASTMMAHFSKLQTPLGAVQKYPTTLAQEERFISLGWANASAKNLWQLWSSNDFMSSRERTDLDCIEPFDEWEEFALFGCHYVLLVADNLKAASQDLDPQRSNAHSLSPQSGTSLFADAVFSSYPRSQGYRRFAAPMALKSPSRNHERVGNFGGMGLNTRIASYDVYTSEAAGFSPQTYSSSSEAPKSRMCHTITDIVGEATSFLIGGRASPDKGLADCWIYHKWLGIWEPVDDLPQPRYRHGAVSLGEGRVLVSPGRGDSQVLLDEYLLWSRPTGWVKCVCDTENKPDASYGATFAVFDCADYRSCTRTGFIAGGITKDGIVSNDVWVWNLDMSSANEPVVSFTKCVEEKSIAKYQPSIARFGASAVNNNGLIYIIGGIQRDSIIQEDNEILTVPANTTGIHSVTPIKLSGSGPRPLLIGISAISYENQLLLMGGSAVCFSFGTFWNKGCYTLQLRNEASSTGIQDPIKAWKYLETIEGGPSKPACATLPTPVGDAQELTSIPRLKLKSASDFTEIMNAGKPVIIEGMDIGPCTELWTSQYLTDQIGAEREVIVHQASSENMSFTSKNFSYVTKPFGDFMKEVDEGAKLYLRSLSTEKPSELPADITTDFPSISKDFWFPPEIRFVSENIHSSPLRISGPVMANVYCQIRGTKRLVLFPPSDFKYFDFEPGASSSGIDVFNKLGDTSLAATHPYEALLGPGDVLYLPPLWLHTASPTSASSVAVNVFFRNMSAGYAAGKDVYGNRDFQAYENGRRDIAKISRQFKDLPPDIRGFYLTRLAKELEQLSA